MGKSYRSLQILLKVFGRLHSRDGNDLFASQDGLLQLLIIGSYMRCWLFPDGSQRVAGSLVEHTGLLKVSLLLQEQE